MKKYNKKCNKKIEPGVLGLFDGLMVSALHYVYMSGPVVVRATAETSLKHLTWLQKYFVNIHVGSPFFWPYFAENVWFTVTSTSSSFLKAYFISLQ